MLDSPIVFREVLPEIIWIGSLGLAGLSVFIAGILLVKHAFRERAWKRYLIRKKEISDMMGVFIGTPQDFWAGEASVIDDEGLSIAINISIEWLRNLSGERAESIIHLMREFGVEAYLERAILHGGLSRKTEALIYCSYENSERTKEHLINYSQDDNNNIQIICLKGLAKRNEVDAVVSVLHGRSLREVRSVQVIGDIFGTLGEPGIAFLVSVANNAEVSIEARIAAVVSMGYIGSLNAVLPLIELFYKEGLDREIKGKVLISLGRIGDLRAAPVIIDGLLDADDVVRINAVNAASKIKSNRFLPELSELIYDSMWWIKFRSVEALARMGGVGRMILEEALDNQRTDKILRDIILEHTMGHA